MITPPLTPSSSFSSSHTPSTPSDPYLTFDFHSAPEPDASRLVLLGNVPKSATSDTLKQSLKQCGPIKGILLRFHPIHGFVVIAFYDSRDAARARAYVPQISVQGATLSARLLSPVILRKIMSGPNAFLDECEALISVSIEDGALGENQLRDLLASFGHLQSFSPSDGCYIADYSDSRCAQAFVNNVHDLHISGARLRAELITPKDLTEDPAPESPSPKPGRVRPRSVSAGESAKPRDLSIFIPPPATLQPVEPTTNSEPEEQRVHTAQPPATQNQFSSPPEVYYPHNPAQFVYPLQSPTAYAFPHFDESTQMHYQYPAYPYMYSPVESHFPHASMHNYHYPAYPTSPPMIHTPTVDYSKRMTQHPENAQSPILLSPVSPMFPTPTASNQNTPTKSSIAPRHQNQKSPHATSTLHVRAPGVPPPPISEKNQLDLKKIEQGLDTRTTVMIKNIPNKMSDKDLMSFIAKVCPRRIDFMYLRMDFQNGCNVGYAFVNFITVEDLLRFTKARLGVKWNMYSSEKVLQMCYANYQGKEALIEKFKNSCIMDEQESYRPKIFHSSGPKQGLPEPFPAPTHLRRKERSLSNRGALYAGNGVRGAALAVVQ